MDPNANLEEMIALAQSIVDAPEDSDQDDASRLADLVLALDEWIGRGGFMPSRWVPRNSKNSEQE